jgi:hypothetical protein
LSREGKIEPEEEEELEIKFHSIQNKEAYYGRKKETDQINPP